VYTAINSFIFGAYALTTILPSFLTAPPTGCEVVGVWEDHSASAECIDGRLLGFDPDDNQWYEACDGPVVVLTDAQGNAHRVELPVRATLEEGC
jgi:hypothetical protein